MSPLKVFSSILITLVIPALPAEVRTAVAAEREDAQGDDHQPTSSVLYDDAQQVPGDSDRSPSESEDRAPASVVVYVDALSGGAKRGLDHTVEQLFSLSGAAATLAAPWQPIADCGAAVVLLPVDRVSVCDWPTCHFPHGPPA